MSLAEWNDADGIHQPLENLQKKLQKIGLRGIWTQDQWIPFRRRYIGSPYIGFLIITNEETSFPD